MGTKTPEIRWLIRRGSGCGGKIMRTHHRLRGLALAAEIIWWLACVALAVAIPAYMCGG